MGVKIMEGVIVGEVVKAAVGLGNIAKMNRLPVKHTFLPLFIDDVGTNAEILVGAWNLDVGEKIQRGFQLVAIAQAVMQNAVDECVAQIEAGTIGAVKLVEKLTADIGDGGAEGSGGKVGAMVKVVIV
jgi:hypothetical protein